MNEEKKDEVIFPEMHTLEDYLEHEEYISIYEELTGEHQDRFNIEPLEFLKLFYKDLKFFMDNRTKYLTIKKYFENIDLNTPIKHYYFCQLWFAIRDILPLEELEFGVTKKSYAILIAESQKTTDILRPAPEPTIENDFLFRIEEIQKYLKTLPDDIARKKYLIEAKTNNKLDIIREGILLHNDYHSFEEKCNLELEKLDGFLALPQTVELKEAQFKLAGKKGSKVDLIRILNAFYSLNLIEMPDGTLPSKIQFMERFGEFLGVNLSNYDGQLSQALKEGTLEKNLVIFEKMIDFVKKNHHTALPSKK